jgi:drug/metabolite transporter (DMT)-like permease
MLRSLETAQPSADSLHLTIRHSRWSGIPRDRAASRACTCAVRFGILRRMAPRLSDRTWLVALAASLWGLSALWRGPLVKEYPALAIVFWEHLVLVVLVTPLLVPAVRRVLAASTRTKVSVVVIGVGSSALATTLFTAAFRLGDPITPQVLQKLQPLIAVALAAVVLRERLRPRYGFFLVPALAGAWLLAFPDPLGVTIASAQAALLAVAAAALWAAGTVLGRAARAELSFGDLTALRFGVGLSALVVTAFLTSTPLAVGLDAAPNILLLALFPGFLALILYYLALGRTPASRATLGELAFPLTAALVGVVAFGARPTGTQWMGMAVVLVCVVGLGLHEQRAKRPSVVAPIRAQDALVGPRWATPSLPGESPAPAPSAKPRRFVAPRSTE